MEMLLNKTDAKENVFPSRVRPVWSEELPVILVYSDGDSREIDSTPRRYRVENNLRIEVIDQGVAENLDDRLDDLASQVEYVMAQDFTLGDLCQNVAHLESQMTIDKEGDQLIGSTVLSYSAIYYADSVKDNFTLGKLREVHSEWFPNGATEQSPETQDALTGLCP